MSSPTRTHVLGLYKRLLRCSMNFPEIAREKVAFNIVEAFWLRRNTTDVKAVMRHYEAGQATLQLLQTMSRAPREQQAFVDWPADPVAKAAAQKRASTEDSERTSS
eukprot:TRINITY_DN32808_c0_g1_i1.p3 TRINITY_DN32808_c0_g1~~TRINITY_DN32808_c0_g1_i1.p3  ORF type:complete len:106 (+),score=26.19 TRINITY_DN32808_c0_g1_i1:908-1225(+)